MKTIIRKAILEDCTKIHEIAEENKLDTACKQNGFLVSAFTVDDYIHFIKEYSHFYVLENNRKIEGFVFGYTNKEMDKESLVNQEIANECQGNFFIIKQICVNRSRQSKNVGTMLYEFLKEQLICPMYAAIVKEPYNEISVLFHQKQGFYKDFEVIAEDGVKRMIFSNNQHGFENHYNQDILEQQYETAVNLYLHEDNLNWSKLNNLFYISGGLVVVISILASLNSNNLLYSIMSVSILGIISSCLFSIAITSGVKYMNNRKCSVMEIERILIQLKGTHLVVPRKGRNSKLFQYSPTSWVMVYMPRLILLVWILTLIASIGLAIIK